MVVAFPGLRASVVLALKLPCDYSDACFASGLSVTSSRWGAEAMRTWSEVQGTGD